MPLFPSFAGGTMDEWNANVRSPARVNQTSHE